jgi:hypothetical protein
LPRGRWIAAAVGIAGLIALLFAYHQPPGERSRLALGAFYTLSRTDQVLPLAGLGLAVAQLQAGSVAISLACFVAGIPFGALIADWIADFASAIVVLAYVLAIGPVATVATGIVLVSPDVARKSLAPVAALLAGAALGLVVDMGETSLSAWAHPAGAILCGLWLAVTAGLIWRTLRQKWFAIAERIFGSWLVAIGMMLGASLFVTTGAS